ncbi:MAG TPA: hypothetical protein PKY81_04785 [bacterium]|nr:hypothetical protein [bacterium]
MPVYIDNIIEDYVAKTTQTSSKNAVYQSKKIIESVNASLSKEPGRTPPPAMRGNQPVVENRPKDLMKGNIVSSYS